MCEATKDGARRQIRTQLNSFSHLDQAEIYAQRARCHREELGGMERWKARSSKAEIEVVVLRSVHGPLRVFSFGEAEPGDPLAGAMQCGGGGGGGGGQASHDERSRCEKVGSDGGEGQFGGRGGGGPFIELESGGRPVHARCPIGREPNPPD